MYMRHWKELTLENCTIVQIFVGWKVTSRKFSSIQTLSSVLCCGPRRDRKEVTMGRKIGKGGMGGKAPPPQVMTDLWQFMALSKHIVLYCVVGHGVTETKSL